MAFICSGASAIGKWLVGSIPSELGYILSYENNLKGLETEVQRLEDTKVSMQHRIDEAEKNKGEKIEDVVLNWQKEASGTIDDAKKLIDTEVGYCLGQCPNLWTRNQLSRGFEEMTQEISQVITNGKFDNISYRVPSEVTITPFCRGYQALESRTLMLHKIKEILKDPKIYMIGVHGMGGVGKTTLMKELAWQVEKDGSFGAVAIADITHSPDVENVQDQIADVLDRKLEKKTDKGRATELRQRIKQEEKVLIILDDIWSELDLTEVGIPFGDEHNGCKLVMTSRDLNVLQRMGTQKEFDLRALLEKDSWILFKKMAGDVVEEINIKPIAKKVTKCCAGLPLLITAMAKGLRKKDVTAWRDALRRLERLDHEELQKKVYPTLELSYNYLENEDLKSLFLFIGSFGLKEIHNKDLFLCCWGLGFYERMHTLTEARDRHHKLINDLRASSLLLEGESKWVQMHDVVCDVAKSIASRFHPFYTVQRRTILDKWPSVDLLKICHYIIILSSYIRELPEQLECPELKLLVLENMGSLLEVPYNFFSWMLELRVLILHGMVLKPSPSTSLNLLINLRSLSLCRCTLEDISMVAKLTNLEILILNESSIEKPIPTHSFAKLKVIKVKRCYGLKNLLLYSLVRNLSQLQEMDISCCGGMTEIIAIQKQEDEKELSNIVLPKLHSLTLYSLPMLQSFYLPLTDDEGNPSTWSTPLALFNQKVETPKLETLELCRIDACKIWDDKLPLLYCLQNLTHLKVNDCYKLTSLFSSSVGRALVKLQHLEISLCLMLKELFVQEEVEFPNLETLKIRLMLLESIWPNQVALNSFRKLKKINIFRCEILDYVFPISVTKELQRLQLLEIAWCDITNIVEKSDSTRDMTLVYLKKLTVEECHNMKTIVQSSVLFQSLDKLHVHRCPGLVNIITSSTTTTLPHQAS